MKIWKNTSTLNGFDDGLTFTKSKSKADIVLMGSKPIEIKVFPNLKGIFRAGIGRDNVPEKEAKEKNIVVRYPSKETIDIIFEETACFTCGLIFRMLYSNVGTLDPWVKEPRRQLSQQNLLVIGVGKIGSQVAQLMKQFLNVNTFDILHNEESELKPLMQQADCISIHIPNINDNISFIDSQKLSWMKSGAALINASRGPIVNEDALYVELQNNRLIAAFDVFWQEPYCGKLKEFFPDHFFMTPHVASTCDGFLVGCRNALDQLIYHIKQNNN
jgi:phosphoglycerate dehydrogenase-like enzyme|tara:strand:+ start:222 stop:1040 length:819 start_codon:yes stop_codon:yes gene_type:complete